MERNAGRTEVLTVASDEPLDRAAQLIAGHGLNHLIVVNATSGHPMGITSSLDIAAVYGA